MYESKDKMVSHPDHYQSEKGLEVIDVIEAFTADLQGIEATDTGNVIKYICRWKKKGGVQDLEKVLWYTQHLIDHLRPKAVKPTTVRYGDVYKNRTIYCDDVVFDDRSNAEIVLSDMKSIINQCGFCLVQDYYDHSCVNEKSSHESLTYGWTSLETADVVKVRDGWKIDLPKPEQIIKKESN